MLSCFFKLTPIVISFYTFGTLFHCLYISANQRPSIKATITRMSNTPAYYRLDGAASSLLLSNHTQVPAVAWLGDRLEADVDGAMLANHEDSALAFANLDARAPLDIFPQLSTGYMGSPALAGYRQNAPVAHSFSTKHIEQTGQLLVVVLEDVKSQLEVVQKIALDSKSDVCTVSTSLKNAGSTDYRVDWLASATLPLPNHFSDCISQHGRWGLENQSYRRAIGPGRIDISNQHGRTGHEHGPNLICASADLSVDHGDALFVHLGWSGNYSFRIERLHDGTAYLQCGVLLGPGEEVVAPGAVLTCPTAYFTIGHGLNQCTQRFHSFARQHILPAWTRTPRPIHANSWEALYFDLNDNDLKALVDAAATIGAERFVLDDGWFPARRTDEAGLGDWTVDKHVFPHGLTPLVEHVRSHNMQFGLWFEPEMVNPDSDLFRKHPEWVLHYAGIETPLARGQLVLDVAREDVSNYLFNCISSLVSEYSIDYIKWDMNRDLVLPGDGLSPRSSKQPQAVYALMQRLIDTHPTLQIESCSSGGARTDFGVLKQTGRVWTSDNIDPIARGTIQQGFARFFPPEVMGAHVGHKEAHLTGRSTNLHTRAIIALQGQFGFELDARVLNKDDVTTLHHYTQLYKQHRSWLSNAIYWQLPTSDNLLLASGLVSTSGEDALFSILLLDSLKTTRPGCQRLRGLAKTQRYRVSLASSNIDQLDPFNKAMPAWCRNSIVSSGELIMNIGIPLPVMPPQSAILVYCALEVN